MSQAVKCDFFLYVDDDEIQKHFKVRYLGCLLDKTVSGEAMALNVINKINNKLKFFHTIKVHF